MDNRYGWLNVTVHELGHALGFSAWSWAPERLDLIRDPSTNNEGADTHFIGRNAIRHFNVNSRNRYQGNKVPLENRPGYSNSHWRESVFQDEVMDPTAATKEYFSTITVSAFRDMGYRVNYQGADLRYVLPSQRRSKPIAGHELRGNWCEVIGDRRGGCCGMRIAGAVLEEGKSIALGELRGTLSGPGKTRKDSMKSLVIAILVAVAALPSAAQQGEWQGEFSTLELKSYGDFNLRVEIAPDGIPFEPIKAMADSVGIEPITEAWYEIKGTWSAEGDSIYFNITGWQTLSKRGDQTRNLIDFIYAFAVEYVDITSAGKGLSDVEISTIRTDLYNGIVESFFPYYFNPRFERVGIYDRERETITILDGWGGFRGEGFAYFRAATGVSRRSWGEIKREMRRP